MATQGDAPYLGDFDTCRALGEFIEQCAVELEAGDRHSLERLWFIFAPTCDWDDAGGSQDVGNGAFAILDRIGRPADK
jgi:hypothetical protein